MYAKQFKFSDGEIAYGHVMEYIPAPTSALLLEQISILDGLPLGEVMWISMVKYFQSDGAILNRIYRLNPYQELFIKSMSVEYLIKTWLFET